MQLQSHSISQGSSGLRFQSRLIPALVRLVMNALGRLAEGLCIACILLIIISTSIIWLWNDVSNTNVTFCSSEWFSPHPYNKTTLNDEIYSCSLGIAFETCSHLLGQNILIVSWVVVQNPKHGLTTMFILAAHWLVELPRKKHLLPQVPNLWTRIVAPEPSTSGSWSQSIFRMCFGCFIKGARTTSNYIFLCKLAALPSLCWWTLLIPDYFDFITLLQGTYRSRPLQRHKPLRVAKNANQYEAIHGVSLWQPHDLVIPEMHRIPCRNWTEGPALRGGLWRLWFSHPNLFI